MRIVRRYLFLMLSFIIVRANETAESTGKKHPVGGVVIILYERIRRNTRTWQRNICKHGLERVYLRMWSCALLITRFAKLVYSPRLTLPTNEILAHVGFYITLGDNIRG